jgi:formate hydrogenlyase subunit 6/NADH:ubiquinone oxidoreductase subunit I
MANPFRLPMAGRALRGLVSRPPTRRYPIEVRDPFPGARGTLEFDLDSCIFCMLCARKCPTGAITCVRDERYFAIEQLNCIACGICVDVCSKDSLSLSMERRPVQTAADRGPDGRRPGHQEWHGAIPDTASGPTAADAKPPATDP